MKGKADEHFPVIVVGGGVAGLTAALDLARAGRPVHLIEKSAVLGGQVARLDKLYPTDHCAFCPVWTQARLCLGHPLITVHTHSCIEAVTQGKETGKDQEQGLIQIIICRDLNRIDPGRCVLCGRCETVCPEDAVSPTICHALPRTFLVDVNACTGCGKCVDVCPTHAIDMERKQERTKIQAENIIWATGFAESGISALPELGHGSHPNIMTSLAFEALLLESGPGGGHVLTPDGKVPRRIAFVQCAGARDQRKFAYCSAVCCMHALKQARWVKQRDPDMDCVIFFTDMRTEGRHYYNYYRQAVQEYSIALVRSRPGLICPLSSGDGLAVRYENTRTGQVKTERFDLVVLNGTLEPCQKADKGSAPLPLTDDDGFVCKPSDLSCGFCRAPADVEVSVVQASSAAMGAYMGKGINGNN